MAATGMAQALVHPKPRVVIVTVGDDLGEPGEGDLRPDVNGLSLTAAAAAAGATGVGSTNLVTVVLRGDWPQRRRITVTTRPNTCTCSWSNTMGSRRGFEGSNVMVAPLRW